MSEPKRHHYVPQMLLRRFTDSNGRLHFFNKNIASKGVLAGRPEDLFQERYLHRLVHPDGSTDNSLERFFSQMESEASPVLDKIISAARARRCPELSADERATWDVFFAYQWRRVPDYYNKLSGMKNFKGKVFEVVAELEREHGAMSPEDRVQLEASPDLDYMKEVLRIAVLRSAPTPLARAALRSRGLGLALVSNAQRSFVVGSNSVVRIPSPGHQGDNIYPGGETWLPVASDVAILVMGEPGHEYLLDCNEDRHIRRVNEASFRQSTIVAARSRSLLQSLVKRHEHLGRGGLSTELE